MDKISTEEIYRLIAELPDGYRTVFNLYAIEGYTHKEIAEQLHISEGTSKSQLNHARKLLQKKIASFTNMPCPLGIKYKANVCIK